MRNITIFSGICINKIINFYIDHISSSLRGKL